MTDLIHHTHQTATNCLNCGKPIHGRADKKFCHAGCKNDYNNRLQRQERAAISEIDLILKHNRRILKEFLGEAPTQKIARLTLVQKGFRFDYFTHQYANYKEDQYRFCYDYGWLALDEEKCLVVRWRAQL